MVKRSGIGIIGVPQDLGASRRGVDMGPSAMRVAGLVDQIKKLGYQAEDYGNIQCHDIDQKSSGAVDVNLRFLPEITKTCLDLKNQVKRCIEDGNFPLVIGGDHSVSIGTLAGLKSAGQKRVGMIWVDAHGDFNTDLTTETGNIHGMPFAVVTGRGHHELTEIGPSPTVVETSCVLIGARDLDREEAENLKKSGVTVFTMRQIDEQGIASIARKAISIATSGVDYLHVSFDIDALDPVEAPGTGTRVQGGLTYREAHLLMEMIHESGALTSLEMVEVNPTLDVRNKTARLGVGLIVSALGKKIIY